MPKYTIEVVIAGTSDDKAVRQFEQSLGAMQAKQVSAAQAATEHKGALSGLASEIRGNLSSAMANLFALGSIAKFFWDGTKAAIEQERNLGKLANTARIFGQDGAAAAAAARALGDALQSKGFDDDQVVQAVGKLLPLTRSTAEALNAVTLAADISSKVVGVDFAQALELVQGLITGKDRALIPAMKTLGIEATTTQGALDELRKKFGGATNALNDNMVAIQSAKQEFADLGKAIGGPISDAIVFAIRWIKSLGAAWGGVGLAAVTAAQTVALAARNVANAARLDFDTIRQDTDATLAQIKAQWVAWKQDMGAIWGDSDGGGITAPGKITSRPKKGDASDAASGESEANKAAAASVAIFNAAQKTKLDLLREEAVLRAKLAADARRGAAEDAATSAKLTEDLRQENIERGAHEYRARLATRTAISRMTLAELQDHKHALMVELSDFRNAAEQKAEIARALGRVQAMIDKSARMSTEEAVAAGVGALAGAWPENKGFAIAQAIINTAQAATRALAEGGPYAGPFLAAAMVAAGVAQIQKIQSTEPGTGGMSGGGASGPSVYTLPQSSYQGAYQTAPTTSNTTQTYQNAPASVVNISALSGASAAAALAEFERARRPAARAYDRQLAHGGVTRMGSTRRTD